MKFREPRSKAVTMTNMYTAEDQIGTSADLHLREGAQSSVESANSSAHTEYSAWPGLGRRR